MSRSDRMMAAIIGAALATALPAAPALAQMTPFEAGFYESCLPDCMKNEELAKRVILHGASIDSAFTVDKAAERIKDVCFSFCGCSLGVLHNGFPTLREQIEAQAQPRRITEFMQSERGRAGIENCNRDRLVLPFELTRPVASFCTERQDLAPGNDGPKLAETGNFRYILENYKFDLRPRPEDAYARDTIAEGAVGFSYRKVDGAAARNHGISGGTGVQVNASRLEEMPQFSIILAIDNQPITGGVDQVHKILENKGLGDEILLCGMRHEYESDRSVWRQEFVVRTRIADPHVAGK